MPQEGEDPAALLARRPLVGDLGVRARAGRDRVVLGLVGSTLEVVVVELVLGESSQLRTNCLSYDACVRPGCQSAADQKREESGVSTSSPSTVV